MVTGWQQWMSYGFHEVKLFLATEAFDAARHFEVFRKRAMVNGGGIGLESPGEVNRWLLESRGGWTETSMLLHIFRGLFTRMVYRYLAAYAPTPVEALIGRRCAQDKTRHIAYSMQHLKYAVKNVRGTAGHINAGLAQAEFFAARDERDPVLWECLACIFGGGVRGMDEGFKIVHKLRRDYVIEYLKTLGWIGVDHRFSMAPNYAALVPELQRLMPVYVYQCKRCECTPRSSSAPSTRRRRSPCASTAAQPTCSAPSRRSPRPAARSTVCSS